MGEANLIYKAIVGVMEDIGAVGKSSTNKQQGFKYRGIDDVMNALNPVLIKHKVFVLPELLEQSREERTSSKGNLLIYSVCKMRYTFFAEDGSNVSAVVLGEGMDSGDKATNKAMAIAYKYACFQTFCIPTEEMKDPDSESHEIEPRQSRDELTQAMQNTIKSEMKRTGITEEQVLLTFKINSLNEMDTIQFKKCMEMFKKYESSEGVAK